MSAAEVAAKLDRVRGWPTSSGYGTALFTSQPGVAWVTGGLEDRVVRNEEPALVWALVTETAAFLIATNIEQPRLVADCAQALEGAMRAWRPVERECDLADRIAAALEERLIFPSVSGDGLAQRRTQRPRLGPKNFGSSVILSIYTSRMYERDTKEVDGPLYSLELVVRPIDLAGEEATGARFGKVLLGAPLVDEVGDGGGLELAGFANVGFGPGHGVLLEAFKAPGPRNVGDAQRGSGSGSISARYSGR